MKDYLTTDQCRMKFIDDNTPLNVTMLLINEGGTLCKGKLTNENKHHFLEWHPMPKRALKSSHPQRVVGM